MSEILITNKSPDYELLDSGDGRKLERFGDFILSRPDPQALWRRSLGEAVWQSADATFEQTAGRGKWRNKREFPEDWKVSFEGVTFELKPSVFKHIGVFPEQLSNWMWLNNKISSPADVAAVSSSSADIGSVKVLNLFAYTGGATLFAARASASVCHIDSSQFAVDCAKANANASGLSFTPIRFIVDDVKKFVEREIRRGQKYDVIVLDPPAYGKGIKKEVWSLEDDLFPLLSRLPSLLSEKPLAVVLSGYASGYSDITYRQILQDTLGNIGSPTFTSGQLAIAQSDSSHLLPAGIFARCEFQNEK